MIDFACKQFNLDEVIKCALGLSKADLKILKHIMKKKEEGTRSEEIAKELKLDLTTVQRGVKKLSDKGVIFRSQENLDSGGYVFVYQIKSKKRINDLIMSIVNNWSNKVENELKNI
jgi:predicted transcriptional regulator